MSVAKIYKDWKDIADTTKTYNVWSSMKQRCLNKNNPSYKNYGGRGIMVCSRWAVFKNFLTDMGEMPKNKSIDRINNNGNYCKSNCRWADKFQQANNRRTNHLLTFKGKTQTVSQWAEELNINNNVIYGRIRIGWSIKKAITTPMRYNNY